MISVEIEEWQEMKARLAQLEQEVTFLRNENARLKRRVKKQQIDEDQLPSSSGNISIDSEVKQMYQNADIIEEQDDYFINNQIKILSPKKMQRSLDLNVGSDGCIDLGDKRKSVRNDIVSNKQNLYPSDIDQIRVSRKSSKSAELQNLIKSQNRDETEVKNQLHLIQQICLFGPTLRSEHLHHLSFRNDQKQLVEPYLYYPQISSDYKEYGNYIFPKKVRIKPTQKMNIPLEGNKIIFKSSKKQDCQIYIFQGNEELHPIKNHHQMLQNVNPSKWLYGIVIEFYDFVFQDVSAEIQKQSNAQKTGRESFSSLLKDKKRGSLLEINFNALMEKQIQMQTVSLKDIELENEKVRMFRSTFSLCIFTYFPFINYLQGVISMIFDEIKLKRIEEFPTTGNLKDCDIFYFVNELDSVAKRIKSYFWPKPVRLGKQLSLKINDTQAHIDLSQQHLYRQLYCSWGYRLMKMMDRDTFYEIYCMIMLQQSVFFVCEDQRTLTFIILLFASMMTKPFIYPYPVVSVLFTEQLLHTPFTSIIGINQSEQWLNESIQMRLIDYENKNFVVINEKEAKVRKRQKFIIPKSQNLKRIFTKFYKMTEPSSLTNIIYRRDSITFNSNPKQTNEYVIDFYAKLQLFYHQNIFVYMPSNMRFPRQEQQSEERNKVQERNKFLSEIEKEYKRLNPNYWRDEFIKLFLKTQIFSIYMMNEYQLQD